MDDADPNLTYRHLLDLWTSGVRDYHSLLSDYLTANSIFVAAIGLLLARQPLTLIFTLLVIILPLRRAHDIANGHRAWPFLGANLPVGMASPRYRRRCPVEAAETFCRSPPIPGPARNPRGEGQRPARRSAELGTPPTPSVVGSP